MNTAPRIALALLALTLGACATCPTTCEELKAAADAQHCPERLVETTVTKFAPVDVGEVEEAPPITSATVPDGATHAEGLQALAADLKASRAWGWTLFHKLMALKKAEHEGVDHD
jgi:hypothetical protein